LGFPALSLFWILSPAWSSLLLRRLSALRLRLRLLSPLLGLRLFSFRLRPRLWLRLRLWLREREPDLDRDLLFEWLLLLLPLRLLLLRECLLRERDPFIFASLVSICIGHFSCLTHVIL